MESSREAEKRILLIDVNCCVEVGGVGPGPDSPCVGEGRAGSGGENVLQPALGPGWQVGQPPSPGTSKMRIRNKISTVKVFYCCQSSKCKSS